MKIGKSSMQQTAVGYALSLLRVPQTKLEITVILQESIEELHKKLQPTFKKPKFTPVIFHNLARYDSHLFIKNLGKTEGDIKCIPNNEEKCISFSKSIDVGSYFNKEGKEVKIKNELRFIDSFKFLPFSLDKLVSNLNKDKLKKTAQVFKDKEQFE